MKAFLVWDGGDQVHVPPALGEPCEDQLTGTVGEQLMELSTRVCYDSMGLDADGKRKGRASEKTLKNVLTVKHHSVLEHFAKTIEFTTPLHGSAAALLCFVNRPGTWVRSIMKNGALAFRVTANTRAIVEWELWTDRLASDHGLDVGGGTFKTWVAIGDTLRNLWSTELPLVVKPCRDARDGIPTWIFDASPRFVEPETDTERHITIYLKGSRGFSHEMVRHRFAISQRSTRYCPESDSPWHWHPMIHHAIDKGGVQGTFPGFLGSAESRAKQAYNGIVSTLEDYLLKVLPEDTPYRKKHARKQARGAARGFLGNALETQLFFTAPVWAWKHIFRMRAADAADAEIRVVISEAVAEVKKSRFAESFADVELVEASDGIGLALADGGHA